MHNSVEGEPVTMQNIFKFGASFGDGAYQVNLLNIQEIVYALPYGYDTSDIEAMGGNVCGMFSGLPNVQYIYLGPNFIAPNVVSTMNMFRECITLAALDLSGLDIRNAEDTTRMFYNCRRLRNIYIGEKFIIKTHNVSDMFTGVNQDGNNVCTIHGSESSLSAFRASLISYSLDVLGLAEVDLVNPDNKEMTSFHLDVRSLIV